MRVTLELTPATTPFVLPFAYNYFIQSLIYRSLSFELADFLHNRGYKTNSSTGEPVVFLVLR